jgi:UDP-N-acetylmuramoyl-tripeptide--D-alanyl-D-alanine ligase
MPTLFHHAEIASLTGGRALGRGPAGPITANSHTMAAGEWFVALAGEGFDDHAAVPEAARRGVAGVVVERSPEVDVPAVVVSDTWQALRTLARTARRRFDGPVVAVTGSYGKTTTCALTRLALSPRGPVSGPEGSANAEPSVLLTLLDSPADAWAQVIEIGTLVPGRVDRNVYAVEPTVRVITNVGPAHLQAFGTLQALAREKQVLFDQAQTGDVCVANADDPRVATMPVPTGARRITFGAAGDVALVEVRADPERRTAVARWRTPEGEVSARLPHPSPVVAQNAAAALAVAWAAEVDLRDAGAALERYEPVGPRLRFCAVTPGAWVIDDTCNANPISVAAALDLLDALPGRHAAVLGDMLELGVDEPRYHAEVVADAASRSLDRLVLVGPRMARASAAAPEAFLVDDPEGAVARLRAWLRPGDHVLLKASHAMHLERVLAGLEEEPG